MRTAVTAGAMPETNKANVSSRTENAGNIEFALGTAFGISFGILGLVMICVGYFSDNLPEQSMIINQAAIKFIIIAGFSLLVGLYGFYKLNKNRKILNLNVTKSGKIKSSSNRFTGSLRVRRKISLHKADTSSLTRVVAGAAMLLLLIVTFSFAATLFLLAPYGVNDATREKKESISSDVQVNKLLGGK